MDRATSISACTVFELRQYTLHPGRRDELIDLFETHLVEPQEDAGMCVVGQFRDLERPDRFVWIRGYPDMPARRAALTAFYVEGDAWARHRSAANATMIDSDDVLLLRPVLVTERFAGVPPAGDATGAYRVAIHHVAGRADSAELAWLSQMRPVLEAGDEEVVAVLRTEHAANNFPSLPVREAVDVLVAVTRHGSAEAAASLGIGLAAGLETAPAERLVLEPTARSGLR